MSITIEFKDVGRDKKTWRAEVTDLSEQSILRALRAGGALMSRDIDLDYDPVTGCGDIIVGMIRHVGTFRRVDPDEIDMREGAA